MDATLWTGTSTASSRTITGLQFKPDFVWAKSRTDTFRHELFDSVRGVGKNLASNSTDSEDTNNQYGYLSSFNSDGFSSSPGSTDNARFNQLNSNFVAWQWQAGQGSSSSNTSGSITSTVSVNATAGFSIVSYTGNGSAGSTVGHGLGAAPGLIIIKNRSIVQSWPVWTSSIPSDQLYLNQNRAVDTPDISSVGSSTFTISAWNGVNGSGNSLIAYCWTPIAGFSSFGSYVGNGSSNGPFIYTGFRPKFILIKATSGTLDWEINDSSRNPYNASNLVLYPNLSNAETSAYGYKDLLSNGFKIRTSDANSNTNGTTYIYAAFAENPFKYANAR
jgi:hypothetical protein